MNREKKIKRVNKSRISQSRIKELEVLVEIVKKMRKDNYLLQGLSEEVKEAVENWKEGYDKALDDFEEVLQNTIKGLNK